MDGCFESNVIVVDFTCASLMNVIPFSNKLVMLGQESIWRLHNGMTGMMVLHLMIALSSEFPKSGFHKLFYTWERSILQN